MKTQLLIALLGFIILIGCAKNMEDKNDMVKSQLEKGTEKAIFAGGCFWCIDAPFEKLDGVKNVISGYTGNYIFYTIKLFKRGIYTPETSSSKDGFFRSFFQLGFYHIVFILHIFCTSNQNNKT